MILSHKSFEYGVLNEAGTMLAALIAFQLRQSDDRCGKE
jgi:hypothetical protein